MDTAKDVHVPFAQLPSEVRVLFFILSLERLYHPHRKVRFGRETIACMQRVWDTEKLTLAVFKDLDGVSDAWDAHLARHAPKGRDAWLRETLRTAKSQELDR